MEFQTVTYAAQSLTYAAELGDISLGEIAREAEPSSAPLSDSSSDSLSDSGPNFTDGLPEGLAAFLLRVAAYFSGCLASFPRLSSPYERPAASESLTVIDTALDDSSEPLVQVRMNRALSRRLRWLIRRGRVQRSDRLRVYNPKAETRCHLTPGQMTEYCIRVYRKSRTVAYGLNRGGHIMNRGGVLSLGMAGVCAAILTPD